MIVGFVYAQTKTVLVGENLGVNFDDKIMKNSPFYLEIALKGQKEKVKKCGVTIGFPDFENVIIKQQSPGSVAKVYSKDTKIWNRLSRKGEKAKYAMVDIYNPNPPAIDKLLIYDKLLLQFPSDAFTGEVYDIYFEVRGFIEYKDGTKEYMPAITKSNLDQQGYTSLGMKLIIGEGSGAEQDQVGYYKNPRFGFSLQYPGDLLTEKTYPENGDGSKFKNKTGTVKLDTFGAHISDESSIEQLYQQSVQSFSENKNLKLVYKDQKENWAFVSGYNIKNNILIYTKYYFINDVVSGFTITYPMQDKEKGIELAEMVTNSFNPSTGDNYEEDSNQQQSTSKSIVPKIETVKAEDLVAFPNDYAYKSINVECRIPDDTTITYRDELRSYHVNLICGDEDSMGFSSAINLAMNLQTVTSKDIAKFIRNNEGMKCIVTGQFKPKNISGSSLQFGTTRFTHTLFINNVEIFE